jgi:hypothetical protein
MSPNVINHGCHMDEKLQWNNDVHVSFPSPRISFHPSRNAYYPLVLNGTCEQPRGSFSQALHHDVRRYVLTICCIKPSKIGSQTILGLVYLLHKLWQSISNIVLNKIPRTNHGHIITLYFPMHFLITNTIKMWQPTSSFGWMWSLIKYFSFNKNQFT